MTVTTQTKAPIETEVWRALDTVRDPELDEPITDLSFVCEVSYSAVATGWDVLVRLRLPTYFCAPNFAYLMVADAKDAVAAVPGVHRAAVCLDDHFASEEINAGVGGGDFSAAFAGQTEGPNLEQLRHTFQRKAYLAALERVCRQLVDAGADAEALTTYRLGDVVGVSGYEALLRRRADLGLPQEQQEWLFVDENGHRIAADDAVARLRFARTVRISIDGNGAFCRGLLQTRYPGPGANAMTVGHRSEGEASARRRPSS